VSRQDVRYLLHLWREGQGPWQASLRAISNGELQTFSDLDEMVGFLATEEEEPKTTDSRVRGENRATGGDEQ